MLSFSKGHGRIFILSLGLDIKLVCMLFMEELATDGSNCLYPFDLLFRKSTTFIVAELNGMIGFLCKHKFTFYLTSLVYKKFIEIEKKRNLCSIAFVICGVDFTKGLSLVSDSNLRPLSQIIVTLFLSPWSKPLWTSQKVSVLALAEPLTPTLSFVNRGSNMAAIIHSPLQNLNWLKIRYKYIKQPPEVILGI